MLVGKGLEGQGQSIVLMTEPYTYDNKITGMPKGTKTVQAKLKDKTKPPRAGICLLYTSPSPRDRQKSRMPSSA